MEENNLKNHKGGKKLFGTIVSNKMKDTLVVRVDRFVKHQKYSKYISKHKNFKVHNTENAVNIGDKVFIEEVKPISKGKHFVLSK